MEHEWLNEMGDKIDTVDNKFDGVDSQVEDLEWQMEVSIESLINDLGR